MEVVVNHRVPTPIEGIESIVLTLTVPEAQILYDICWLIGGTGHRKFFSSKYQSDPESLMARLELGGFQRSLKPYWSGSIILD